MTLSAKWKVGAIESEPIFVGNVSRDGEGKVKVGNCGRAVDEGII